jgi:hypothetical protein
MKMVVEPLLKNISAEPRFHSILRAMKICRIGNRVLTNLLSTQQHEQTLPRKCAFTAILDILCKILFYIAKIGRLAAEQLRRRAGRDLGILSRSILTPAAS